MSNTTFKEIIYNIKNLRQGGRQSQDALLSDAQYAFIIDYYRAILIRREFDARKVLAPQFEQTIEANFSRVREMEHDVFKDYKVFKADVPTVVQTTTRPLFEGVRTSMLETSLPRSNSKRIRSDLKSPFSGHKPRYFPLGDTLYVVTPDPLQKLFVSGVFERPIKIEELKGTLDPFDPYNFDYPISFSMIDALYKMMTDGEIKFSLLMPNDLLLDGVEQNASRIPRSATQPTSNNED